MQDNSIKSKALRGTVWVALEKFSCQIIQFIIGIILARLLSPGDYGIVGMLAIFLSLANTLVDSGMTSALIQKQDRTDEDYSTTFVFNFVASLIIYVILFFAAPYIASFYKTPVLKSITRVISIPIVINSFSAVNRTKLSIELRFREQSIISVISLIFSGLIGIFMAFQGYGVWTLVIQSIVGSFVTSILLILITKWFPGLNFSKKAFEKLFGFGSRILGTSLLYTLYINMYTLVIGRAFSPVQVGYYNRGDGYAKLPVQTFAELAHKVYFPVLSKVQDDNQKLIIAYTKMVQLPMYLLFPILVGVAAIAEPLIVTMIGEKWLPCVPILQILCIGYMFGALTDLNLNLLMVKGRSDLILRLDLIKKPIAFSILFLSIPLGIMWMVILKSIYEVIAFLINCYYTKKILDYGALKQLKSVLPIMLKSLAMGAIVYFSIYFISTMWLKLVVGIIIGVAIYLIFSLLSKDSSYEELKNIVINLVKR